MIKPAISIDHNAASVAGGTYTYGSNYQGRFGGVFRYDTHVSLHLTDIGVNVRLPVHAHRRAQRLLLQHLKGYKVC